MVENQDNTAVQCACMCLLRGSFNTELLETLGPESDTETARADSDAEGETPEEEKPARLVDTEDEPDRGVGAREHTRSPA
ncbi:hypothetical protein EG329_011732 [Mollisiaceae sp. DMI_Dod_QoI]|nr:hypothetical protein EG329_011732 [Helotiales sp. DMI_Dod_QoI]